MAIITISRGTKSWGQALAECLAEHLHYPIVGREENIKEAASKLGVSEEAVGHQMQDTPRLWGRKTLMRKTYVAAVQACLAERVIGGNLVYHGLAGQVLLRGLPAVLRLRLIAPFEARVRAMMAGDQIDQASAEQFIREADDARARWVKMMYGEDIMNPALYDMIINLEAMSVLTVCALVSAAVEQPAYVVTEKVMGRLRDFNLACQVRVALLRGDETRALNLEVDAQDGVVQVSGSVPLVSSEWMEDQITRVACAVPGVGGIRLKVQRYDPSP